MREPQELVRRPVNAFTLWKPEAVAVSEGEELIGEYHETLLRRER